MPIKPFKSIDEQLIILRARGLKIRDEAFFKEYILKNNYFNVINGNEDLLLVNPPVAGQKLYDTATFDDFVRLHKFDKILTNGLTSILHDFETRLKASIAKNFCYFYCRTTLNTMQYTNKNNFNNLSVSPQHAYTLYHDQYRKIVDDFDEFLIFQPNFLYTLTKYNDFVDARIFSTEGAHYSPPADCCSYQDGSRQIVVPLWVAIETFDFGTLIRFVHYVKSNVMNGILKDFGLESADRDMFLNSLDIIREIRNKCAHFSLINRFSTSLSVKVLPVLVNRLHLHPMKPARTVRGNLKHAAKLSLFDTLQVLGMYESLTRLKKPLKALIYQNNRSFKKRTYDLNERMLERMGNKNYKDWKHVLY
ncbi:Abi family protein [Paenibacillus wenxiniae]|uniref:Abi family protein n=1 Tax=Paenibacillus wenxiniae TaxID=1636843 RepID=A0ABW4RDZ7_9BACL